MEAILASAFIVVGAALTIWAVGTIAIAIGMLIDGFHLLRSASHGEYTDRDREILALAADGTWALMKTVFASGLGWPLALAREVREGENT